MTEPTETDTSVPLDIGISPEELSKPTTFKMTIHRAEGVTPNGLPITVVGNAPDLEKVEAAIEELYSHWYVKGKDGFYFNAEGKLMCYSIITTTHDIIPGQGE